MQCGLLGRHLGHSYSPQIHKMLANYDYQLFEIEPELLGDFLRSDKFDGLNVTIPYKKAVIPYCNALTDCARALGAVNTIVRKPDGTLIGHNTDYYGFQFMFRQSSLSAFGKKALVLGSGGASATVTAVLKKAGANVIIISRSDTDNYNNLDRHYDASIIVNTTPVGMYPDTGFSPVDLTNFHALEGVFDLIYNPARTRLLQMAEEKDVIAMNGLTMLVAQAKEAAQWFTENNIPDEKILSIHRTLQKQMQNIILIGMPGCGKSTIGKALAHAVGKQFIDADSEIEKEAGISIPQFFSEKGESAFREMETHVLTRLCKESGCVIATGGGCVTRDENYSIIHQNAQVFWIKRDLDNLPTEGRPLSQSTSLSDMYQIREPMYKKFSDFEIDNISDIDHAVKQILDKLEEYL